MPPPIHPRDPLASHGRLSIGSESLTLWGCSGACEDTMTDMEVRIAPERPLVIGRGNGSEVPYLHPEYRPTALVPKSDQTVLSGEWTDIKVSRGHFMLRAARGGMVLINGVPGRDGNIRPPMNGTWLLAPTDRPLLPAEEYWIAPGDEVELKLPNGAVVQIRCD